MKTAVITGAGGGLGRALALQLAMPGAQLLLSDVHEERCAETARLVEARGARAHTTCTDVAAAAQVEALGDAADRLLGRIDLVVNNAGVAAAGAVGAAPLETWRWIMGINLWGVIHGCHVFAPRLVAQRGGAVLNVASAAGIACAPTMAPYNVTKSGVIALSETLAAELAPHGVGVTVLCPVFFKTNLLETMRVTDAEQSAMAAAAFADSTMTAEQVAAAALRAVARRQLYCLPMREARMIWRLKRLMPQRFHRSILGSARLQRLAKRRAVSSRRAAPAARSAADS
ncbi:MAG: SDR family NAD(P)-dependent oxidoreductase [Deltaproteobacteria bacterium]|nr:SDR family NAD(P)-dependent oxidoreductase [Deltaproteobacteria bacterium]